MVSKISLMISECRKVTINNHLSDLNSSDLFIGEPVIYKIYFPDNKTFLNVPFFYIFCYIKEQSNKLNVYFQSANPKSRLLDETYYNLESNSIKFEGLGSVLDDNDLSVVSISDPGHFVPGMVSSFYLGTQDINFAEIVSKIIAKIAHLADIKLKDTLLFGSSAGSMGALFSSTYFGEKINVMAVNSQISMLRNKRLINTLYPDYTEEPKLAEIADRLCCYHRFSRQTDINSIPNLYLLANINDDMYQRSFNFYKFYQQNFTKKGINNQSMFDSYFGVEGHGRPHKIPLKTKIKFAREMLTMESN